ncbi:MAG: LptF/LptG family permease, partial [Hyphomicrobiaceae bacterium]
QLSFLQRSSGGAWLRQEGADGSSVLTSASVTARGLKLGRVMILQYDRNGAFVEHIEGKSAQLKDGYWEIEDALVTRTGTPAERFATYQVSTYLSPERVQDALGTAISMSFWELPGIIEATEKAGLSANQFRIQYELLLSRPLLLIAMVLMGATVSLRSFRSGKIQTMVVYGMLGGFAFLLLAEVSRQVGIAGLVSPSVAVWVPVCIATLTCVTVLLYQEDG